MNPDNNNLKDNMLNNAIDFKRLSQEIGKRNKQVAKIMSNDMFKSITDSEWATVLEAENDPVLGIVQKIQDCIYNYYVTKLISQLHEVVQANKNVDASIYGGILEGLYESNIKTIIQESCKRQKDRQEKVR
jgi:hypothetical protein